MTVEFESTSNSVQIVFFGPVAFQDVFISQVENIAGISREVITVNVGTTLFRPIPGAHPMVGSIGQLQHEPELRIAAVIPERVLEKLLDEIDQHPYETYVLEVYDGSKENPHLGDVKIRSRVPAKMADLFMESMSNEGAGVIGNYDYCFFIYPDEKDPQMMQIETICDSQKALGTVAAVQELIPQAQLEILTFAKAPVRSGQQNQNRTIATQAEVDAYLKLLKNNH